MPWIETRTIADRVPVSINPKAVVAIVAKSDGCQVFLSSGAVIEVVASRQDLLEHVPGSGLPKPGVF